MIVSANQSNLEIASVLRAIAQTSNSAFVESYCDEAADRLEQLDEDRRKDDR